MAHLDHTAPHALTAAHSRLSQLLREACSEWQHSQKYSRAFAIIDRIDRFVDELARVPGAETELIRRAVFEDEQCGSGSMFSKLMRHVIAVFRSEPIKSAGPGVSDARYVVQKLREIERAPMEIPPKLTELRRLLERGCQQQLMPPSLLSTFEALREEVERIENESERLECNGCNWLWHSYAGRNRTSAERSRAIRATIECGGAGGQLESILAAADSMMAWVSELKLEYYRSTNRRESSSESNDSFAGSALTDARNTSPVTPNQSTVFWTSPNDPRDEWLYEQRLKRKPFKEIIAELNRNVHGWDNLSDAGSVNAAIKRYCGRHPDKPRPPRQQHGRPKTK